MASTVSFASRALLLVSASVATIASQAQDLPSPPTGPAPQPSVARAEADRLAATLVAQMTTEEKLPQLLNVAPAIPRLNIPAYNWWTESLHGALGPIPTTNFPEPIGLAASFDAPLVHQVAGAISTEVRALHTQGRQTGKLGRIGTGLDTWSPNINIFRDPRWGRGQETYGEDPYLAARMGVAFVTGMQGPNPDLPRVISTPKHFAVHSGPESTRHAANVYVSPHDLEDTYLPAFRAAIVEGRAGSIMCAYNRIEGQPACASDLLLKDHLRGAWGFTGYVVSDCDAVKDIADNHKYAPDQATAVAAAMKAGVDNECNTQTIGDIGGLPDRFGDALKRNLISQGDIDRTLVRLFSARLRNGDLPGVAGAPAVVPVSAILTPDHVALALEAAEKSLVLLKNDGVLPLRPGARIAVVGPLGDATRVLRGNYSSTQSAPPVSVVEGLRQAAGASAVTLVPFGESITDGDRVPPTALLGPDGKPGLLARYFNPVTPPVLPFKPGTDRAILAALTYQDRPAVTRREVDVAARAFDLPTVNDYHRTEWTGFLVAPETGSYRLGLGGSGLLEIDGHTFLDVGGEHHSPLPTLKTVTLQKGQRYRLRLVSTARGFGNTDLVWKRPVGRACRRQRADRQDQSSRSLAADLLPQRGRPPAIRRLCDDRAHLSLLHRYARLPVRLRPELHTLRLRPADRDACRRRCRDRAARDDRGQQHRPARGRRSGTALPQFSRSTRHPARRLAGLSTHNAQAGRASRHQLRPVAPRLERSGGRRNAPSDGGPIPRQRGVGPTRHRRADQHRQLHHQPHGPAAALTIVTLASPP